MHHHERASLGNVDHVTVREQRLHRLDPALAIKAGTHGVEQPLSVGLKLVCAGEAPADDDVGQVSSEGAEETPKRSGDHAENLRLFELAQRVPVHGVGNFVGQDERERVIIRNPLQQAPEDVDEAARKAERIDVGGVYHLEAEGEIRTPAHAGNAPADALHARRQNRVRGDGVLIFDDLRGLAPDADLRVQGEEIGRGGRAARQHRSQQDRHGDEGSDPVHRSPI